MKKYLPLIFILLFSWILQFQLYSEQVLLTDDLLLAGSNVDTSFNDFLTYTYDNSPILAPRPISVLITAGHTYLIKYFGVNILYIGYVYYTFSLILIYKVINDIYNHNIAILGTFIYSLLPIGTFLSFSIIMLNSNIATIFYCLSLLYIFKIHKQQQHIHTKHFYIVLSILFYFLSALSYEIFIPLIIINLYFLRSKISYNIIYLFSALCLVFGYREYLSHLLFNIHPDIKFSNYNNLFNIKRNIFIAKEIILMYIYHLPTSIFRGIRNIVNYNSIDFSLLLGSIIFNYFLAFKSNFKISQPKFYLFMIFIIGMILSFVPFISSHYTPSLFEYKNRVLGSVRLFTSLCVLSIFVLLFQKYNRYIKLILFITLSILCINLISIKNAWIYVNNFHNNLFLELKKHIPTNPKTHNILIKFDKSKNISKKEREPLLSNPNLVLKEPILSAYINASPYLRNRNEIDSKFNIHYYYFGIKSNPWFRDLIPPKKYYLYDYKTKTMEYVEENP